MTQGSIVVTSNDQLSQAVQQPNTSILVEGTLENLSAIKLLAGCSLVGDKNCVLRFKAGQPGINLTENNHIENLKVEVDEAITAISFADESKHLGTISIKNVQLVGRLHLEAANAQSGELKLHNIHVSRADVRMAAHRPAGFGVDSLLGAVTIYNYSKNKDSRWTLHAENLSCGSKEHPVRGSGVFVFGGNYVPTDADMSTAPAPTQEGGRIHVTLLSTGDIHSDGGISAGTPNLITAGVFLGSGAHADLVQNNGVVVTYGINDMVLDNWGVCKKWVATSSIVSHNTSGIGFVNFGDIQDLQVLAPIETHGIGARGFNLYDGNLGSATFQSITTHGNGAIGIQLSKPFGTITVKENIRTTGGEGESLVRGKIVTLKAHALSLKPGVKGKALTVLGEAIAENSAIPAYEFAAPATSIGTITVHGKSV